MNWIKSNKDAIGAVIGVVVIFLLAFVLVGAI
jgi:hypothetical protein